MNTVNTWPGWESVRLIGSGSYGNVYEIQRSEFGTIYKAALKVISVPGSRAELEDAYQDSADDASVTAYFKDVVENIVSEFALMSQFKGHSNFVSYEDHMVIEHEDEIGWDILIRMELLEPLTSFLKENVLDEKTILKMGIDLCTALEVCKDKGVIHRDIKPDNIFVSERGDFKLGDFGVARVIEKTTSGLSKKGTFNYMAPEVYRGEEYGFSADIYSVGILLYRFLNEGRLPFLPPMPEAIKYGDKEEALVRRMRGDSIPKPKLGSDDLKTIVLMACAGNPKDRFSSPAAMRSALVGQLKKISDNQVTTTVFEQKREISDQIKNIKSKKELKKSSNRTIALVVAAILILILVPIAVTVIVLKNNEKRLVDDFENELSESGEELTLHSTVEERIDPQLIGSWDRVYCSNAGQHHVISYMGDLNILSDGHFFCKKLVTDWVTQEMPMMQTVDNKLNLVEALSDKYSSLDENCPITEIALLQDLTVTYELKEYEELHMEAVSNIEFKEYFDEIENEILVIHYSGIYSKDALSPYKVDYYEYFCRAEKYTSEWFFPDLYGRWKDELGNEWLFTYAIKRKYLGAEVVFQIRDTNGILHDSGSLIWQHKDNNRTFNIAYEDVTKTYVIISYDGIVLQLKDEAGNLIKLERY